MVAFNSGAKNAEIGDVAQLSRPYQIALGAVAVLGLVWMMALRGHAANPSERCAKRIASRHAPSIAMRERLT